MLTLGIELDKIQLRKVLNAVHLVVLAARFQARELPRKMSQDFVLMVRADIVNQTWVKRWSSRGRKYEKRYKEWKSEHGYPLNFWKLTGALIGSVSSFKVQGGWMGGIPNGATSVTPRYAGSRTYEIVKYAKILEYGGDFKSSGGGVHPERPVFQHSFNKFYRIGVDQLTDKALEYIGGKWS